MALYSDMNGFPESGFPVLADTEDRLTLNTLYYNPIKHLGYKLDVEGNNRLRGNLVLGGTLTGVTAIVMGGALSGATIISASNDINMSGGNLNITTGNINMTGFIGSVLKRVKKAWFTDLHIKNRPTCGDEDFVALLSDLPKFESGRFSPTSASVTHSFTRKYSDIPVGRKSVHVYRTVEPEAGVIIDQDVLFHSLVVTTTGFSLTIDPSEDLTGVIIEYTFYKKNTI